MKGFTRLISVMNGAGVVWVFALTFLICADITGRTVFDSPIRGVPEMVSLSLVACVFLQVAFAIHKARLTQAEFLLDRVAASNPRLTAQWRGIMALIGAFLLALIAIGMAPDFLRAFRNGHAEGGLARA